MKIRMVDEGVGGGRHLCWPGLLAFLVLCLSIGPLSALLLRLAVPEASNAQRLALGLGLFSGTCLLVGGLRRAFRGPAERGSRAGGG